MHPIHLMNQQIAVSRYVVNEESPYHEPLYAAPVTVPARVERQPGITRGKNGESLPSYATVYTVADVQPNDRLTLPDGTERYVISVLRAVDGDGRFSHSVVKV